MEKKWNGALLPDMQGLSKEECSGIAGGFSLWAWIGYVAAGVVNGIRNENGVQSSGQKTMNTALE